jgi:hypothetical protein
MTSSVPSAGPYVCPHCRAACDGSTSVCPNCGAPMNRLGGILASDDERDQAISKLTDHFQAGRLTTEEFDERSGLALRARTQGELTALFADLPPDRVPMTDPVVGVGGVRPRLPCRTSWIWVAIIVIALAASGGQGLHGVIGLVPAVAVVLFVLRRRESARRRCRPPAEGERHELD